MSDRRKTRGSYIKVGVLIVIALSAVAALALLISGTSDVLSSGRIKVRAYFESSGGLEVGAPVNLDGVTVGNVSAIHLVAHPARTPVEVWMVIRGKYAGVVPSDSTVSIKTVSVLGHTVVDIDNRHAHGQPVKNNAVLSARENRSAQAVIESSQALNQKLNTVLSQTSDLASSLTGNKGSIGQIINNPTLRERAAAATNQFKSAVQKVSEGKGSIGKLMASASLRNRAKDTAGKVEHIRGEIQSGKGTLGKFVQDPTLSNNLRQTSKQLSRISAEVKSGQGAIGMMAKNRDFRKKLHQTGQQLSSLRSQVRAGKGTVGQFIKNRALANHLKELTTGSRKLVTEIRKSPRKYFSFRVRLF